MKRNDQPTDKTDDKSRIQQAEARTEQAEARTEQAKTRAEHAQTRADQAEARTEQAKTRAEHAQTRAEQAEARTEQAKTRAEHAQTRTEQAEAALQQAVESEDIDLRPETSPRFLRDFPARALTDEKTPLEQLTARQREILQLIAKGQNTKQIAHVLKVSPKTVEYHRMKLMAGLNLHDIAGLVRFAVRVGLITPEH